MQYASRKAVSDMHWEDPSVHVHYATKQAGTA